MAKGDAMPTSEDKSEELIIRLGTPADLDEVMKAAVAAVAEIGLVDPDPVRLLQDVWPAFRYILPTDYGTFTFRTMVEANFLPSNNNEVRYRPRQMLRFMHPFEFEPRLSLITWNETFLIANTTKQGGQSGFTQNRDFIGAGWTFNKNFRFEGGYMNQYLEGAHYSSTSYDHNLIMTSLFLNF